MSFVISNMETWPFLKISRSLASALIIVRLFASWRLFFLMYSQTFFVTSVRGTGRSPMIAASELLGVIAFMNAAFGVRFLAGAFAFFAAFAAFLTGAAFFVAAFFAAGRLAGAAFFPAFFAVAMSILSIK